MTSRQDARPPKAPSPRHPSAGNLGRRPTAVRPAPEVNGRPTVPVQVFWLGEKAPKGVIRLGPDLADDTFERLIGHVEGRRVLELGCATGMAVELARRGAKVIVVEPSLEHLAATRAAADEAGVKIEFHHGEIAELPFVRADQIDLAVSVHSLSDVDDLGHVFRQVHRVLRSEAPLLITLPHPMALMTNVEPDGVVSLVRTAFDGAPLRWSAGGVQGTTRPHQLGEVFTTLTRANFRVDTMVEPRPVRPSDRHSDTWSALSEWVPTTAIIRARKQGT